jgi:hypothetical protein
LVALKRHSKALAVFLVVVIVVAALVASWLWTSPHVYGDNVGICVHFLSAEDARLVNESGARWIRIDASDNLTDFDVSICNAKAYNLSVLVILDSWMFGQNTTFTLEQWKQNITYYVSNYADAVDAWEIWNEPVSPAPNWALLNLAVNQSDTIVEENLTRVVDFYHNMAQTAYPIIRQYDPNAKILLFGGLSLYPVGDINVKLDREFAAQLADRNIQRFGDVMSVHAYTFGKPSLADVQHGYDDSLVCYRGFFSGSLEVWVTETGKPIEENGVDAVAGYLNDALAYFDRTVSRVFWFSLHDNVNESLFGLIENVSNPRPAYIQLQGHSR